MMISVGILAWNEAGVIGSTVASLLAQTAFAGPSGDLAGMEWEIVVVPNGCTDDTAGVARKALAEHADGRPGLSWAVHELAEPGKSNAWNRYVHDFSSARAEVIVMVDADIQFGQPQTISNMVKALLANPQAVVAVDQPLKDAVRKPNKTLLEKISVAASGSDGDGDPGITGQLFCARASALREIWMPKGLSVEDGFLHSMIVTDGFRSPPDGGKVIRADNASHYYETVTSLRSIFRHEIRLVIGTTLNCYLTWDFLLFAVDPQGPGAGRLIQEQVTRDPSWYPHLMTNMIKNRGPWVLPRGMLLRRFSGLKEKRGARFLRSLSIGTVGFLFDLPVFVAANQKLKSGRAIGFW